MDLESLKFLRTPAGSMLLQQATDLIQSGVDLLTMLTRLQKQVSRDALGEKHVRAAVETGELRQKAKTKFSWGEQGFFSKEALEQSSSEAVSTYRSKRYQPYSHVLDACCGIGADAISLADISRVTAVDNDPLRLALAQFNAELMGRSIQFLEQDVLTGVLPTDVDAVFFDPDRRADGIRHVRVTEMVPDVKAFLSLWPDEFPIGIKLAPGVFRDELDDFDAEVEYISLNGELKECVTWLGSLRTARRRATMLPSGESFSSDSEISDEPTIQPLGMYLHEPDPVFHRAGLVSDLAEKLQCWQIDHSSSILSSDELIASPFIESFRVEASFPFQLKALRKELRSRDIGRLTILKRGAQVDVNQLQKQLKLEGSRHVWLMLTQIEEKSTVILAEKVSGR
jgi:SAM-dependent methyltransferase